MELPILTMDDIDVAGKTVILRVDINSPIDPATGQLKDDNRIRKSAPTILELAEKIIKMTGSKSKIIFRPLPEDDPIQRRPDISLARKELGNWKPAVSLDEGLQKTIHYFRQVLKA